MKLKKSKFQIRLEEAAKKRGILNPTPDVRLHPEESSPGDPENSECPIAQHWVRYETIKPLYYKTVIIRTNHGEELNDWARVSNGDYDYFVPAGNSDNPRVIMDDEVILWRCEKHTDTCLAVDSNSFFNTINEEPTFSIKDIKDVIIKLQGSRIDSDPFINTPENSGYNDGLNKAIKVLKKIIRVSKI